MATPDQAAALVTELRNPKTFGRHHRVPTTPADQEGFDPAGGYRRGAVRAPTEMMVVRGLERYGKKELAREIALEHLDRMAEVFRKTGTVWENYSPDRDEPGVPAGRDFVGWSGIGPIAFFLEYAVGLHPDGPTIASCGRSTPRNAADASDSDLAATRRRWWPNRRQMPRGHGKSASKPMVPFALRSNAAAGNGIST